MSDDVFDNIFIMMDTDGTHAISMDEMVVFFEKFTSKSDSQTQSKVVKGYA